MVKVKKTITKGIPDSRSVGTPEEESMISDIRGISFEEQKGEYLGHPYKPPYKEHYTKVYGAPYSKVSSEVKTLSPHEKELLKKEIEDEERSSHGIKTWSYEGIKHAPREGSRIWRTIAEVKKRGSAGMTIEEFQGGQTGKEHLAERTKVVKARGYGCQYRNLRPYMKGSRSGLLEQKDGKLFYRGK